MSIKNKWRHRTTSIAWQTFKGVFWALAAWRVLEVLTYIAAQSI